MNIMEIKRKVVISGVPISATDFRRYIVINLEDLTPAEKPFYQIGDKVEVIIKSNNKK